MSVTATAKRTSAAMVLNAGTDDDGRTLTKNVGLTGLRGGPDHEKIMNVTDLAAPVLMYPIARVELTEVKTLERE